MSIKVGDKLPEGNLTEFVEVESAGCSIGPHKFNVADLAKGKKIAIFAVPGAFTPTCSAKHAPGYLVNFDKFKAKGVDEIWCIAVNDAFVMGAWADSQGIGKDEIVMLGDGNGDLTRQLGLTMDAKGFGMGERSQRYSMIVKDGVVSQLNIEQPGEFRVSSAEHLLAQL